MANTFDVEGARKAGYSDEEINSYISANKLTPKNSTSVAMEQEPLKTINEAASIPERAGGAAALGLNSARKATGVNPSSLGGITSVDANTLTQAAMNPKETAGKLVEAGKEAVRAFRPGFSPADEQKAAFEIGKTGAAIMMMVVPGNTAAVKPASVPRYFSRQMLGFSKRFIGNKLALAEANQAAEMVLEKDLIPASADPALILRRVESLKKKSGEMVGKLYDNVGEIKLDSVFDGLETVKQKLVGNKTGGEWDIISKKIEHAQDTVLGLLNEEKVDLKAVNSAKKVLNDTVSWLSDNTSQAVTKALVNNIRNSMQSTFKAMGGNIDELRLFNKLYGASSNAVKALNNRLSMGGNMPISLPAIIASGGSSLPGQILKAGLVEGIKRRGAGIAAKAAYGLQRQAPNIIPAMSSVAAYPTSLGLSEDR